MTCYNLLAPANQVSLFVQPKNAVLDVWACPICRYRNPQEARICENVFCKYDSARFGKEIP